MPTVSKDINFDCTDCNYHNTHKLEGMADFF
jgi:hypothetical protein